METIETQVPGSSKRILITGILLAFLLPSVVLLADRYFLPVLHIDILSAGSFLFRDAYYGSRLQFYGCMQNAKSSSHSCYGTKRIRRRFYVAALMIMMLVIFAGSVGIKPADQTSRPHPTKQPLCRCDESIATQLPAHVLHADYRRYYGRTGVPRLPVAKTQPPI